MLTKFTPREFLVKNVTTVLFYLCKKRHNIQYSSKTFYLLIMYIIYPMWVSLSHLQYNLIFKYVMFLSFLILTPCLVEYYFFFHPLLKLEMIPSSPNPSEEKRGDKDRVSIDKRGGWWGVETGQSIGWLNRIVVSWCLIIE